MDTTGTRTRDGADALAERVARVHRPLRNDADLDPLIDRLRDARVVLLGEASHGTSEFYGWRHRISRRLIEEHGFGFIAVEGDWPDCWEVDRYVRGRPGAGPNADAVLHAFRRWPTWMWANREVVALAEWMHDHNRELEPERRVGFFGLDVYSLWESMEAVLDYLEDVDADAARRARDAYGCFDPYGGDAQEYAFSTRFVPDSCEEEVVSILTEIRQRALQQREGTRGADEGDGVFNAEQNALVAKNAERYYRAMVRGGPDSWNLRDLHMMETLERLLEQRGDASRAIVWEHNTHIGDARATDMAAAGMLNVGQLARERWGERAPLVGFSSHRGSVIAGRWWGAPMERMEVPPARQGSWEHVLHDAVGRDALLLSPELLDGDRGEALERRGHRAIGVVYKPAEERFGNYVPTVLPRRYDALLHIDESHALSPLHMRAEDDSEPPETFPSGF